MGENAQPFFSSSSAVRQGLAPHPTALLGVGAALLPAGVSLGSSPGGSFAHRQKTFSSITISTMEVYLGPSPL